MLPPQVIRPGEFHPYRVPSQELRYLFYVVKLKYEPPNDDKCETDEYDHLATIIVVVEGDCVVGMCRLIPSTATNSSPPFVHELGTKANRRIDFALPTYEVSRTIVYPEANRPPEETARELEKRRCRIARALYDAVYEFLAAEKIQRAYAVVEPKFVHKLARLYSPKAFAAQGESYLAVTPAGVELEHVLLEIDVDAWSECYLPTDEQVKEPAPPPAHVAELAHQMAA